ncbi:hypothetical protein BaRGS_00025064, partial [Batillaria attramentaria]
MEVQDRQFMHDKVRHASGALCSFIKVHFKPIAYGRRHLFFAELTRYQIQPKFREVKIQLVGGGGGSMIIVRDVRGMVPRLSRSRSSGFACMAASSSQRSHECPCSPQNVGACFT